MGRYELATSCFGPALMGCSNKGFVLRGGHNSLCLTHMAPTSENKLNPLTSGLAPQDLAAKLKAPSAGPSNSEAPTQSGM